MDLGAEGCKSGGKARCCLPNYSDTIEVENPKLDEYRDALKLYLKDPVCANPGSIVSRRDSLQMHTPPTTALSLLKRADASTTEVKTRSILLEILATVGTSAMLDVMEDIWDGAIGDKWANLKVSSLRPFVKDLPEYGRDGPIQIAHDIVCSPNSWNNRVGGDKTVTCVDGFCTQDNCEGRELVQRPSRSPRSLSVRELGPGGAEPPTTAEWQRLVRKGQAVKRAARQFTARLVSPDGRDRFSVIVTLPGYYTFSQLDPSNPIFDELLDYASFDDCGNMRLAQQSIPMGGNNGRYYNSKGYSLNLLTARIFQNTY